MKFERLEGIASAETVKALLIGNQRGGESDEP